MENVSVDEINFHLSHIRYFVRANMEIMNEQKGVYHSLIYGIV